MYSVMACVCTSSASSTATPALRYVIVVFVVFTWCSLATVQDLWQALSEVSHQDVGALMSTWTRQPGYPVLLVEELPAAAGGKRRLRITQRRFFRAGLDDSDTALWNVPITLFWQGAATTTTVVMKVRLR